MWDYMGAQAGRHRCRQIDQMQEIAKEHMLMRNNSEGRAPNTAKSANYN